MRSIVATMSYVVMSYIHALLTFEAVLDSVRYSLKPLPAQIGESSMFDQLVSPLAFELITISVVLFLFYESSHMCIRLFEYVAILPESARTDRTHQDVSDRLEHTSHNSLVSSP